MNGPDKPSRTFKAVTDEDQIAERLQQSAISETMYLKTGMSKFPVKMVGEINRLSVNFISPKRIKADKIRVFWLNGFHLEFEGVLNCGAETEGGDNNYRVRIIRMLTPETTRIDKRFRADEHYFRLGKISYSAVRENYESISQTPEYSAFLKNLREKLGFFSFVGVYPRDMEKAPSEIIFSQYTNSILFIRNLSSYNSYLTKNEFFFNSNPRMKARLENRLKTLNLRYSSLLVRPVDYLPMAGRQFPIAYVVAAKEKDEIQNEDILAIDELSLDLYNKLTESFYRNVQVKGKFENISVSGARIFISDDNLYQELSDIDIISFVLRIIGVADIPVSGKVMYVHKKKRGFYLGVQFKRSAFGSRFSKFLFNTIQAHKLPAE